MELFVQGPADKTSLGVELFSHYVRATSRNIVNIKQLSDAAVNSLKLTNQVPFLMKPNEDEEIKTSNPQAIMLTIAKACYLEEPLFHKQSSNERSEISSFIEMASRLSAKELIDHVNTHMATKMFLVGHSVTAADVMVLAHVLEQFQALNDLEKIGLPNAFRWVDHIQHLPGMLELVQAKGLFVTFPDESAEPPSKAQLKKLAKMQAAADKKAGKKVAAQTDKEKDGKDNQQKQQNPNEETKEGATEQPKKQKQQQQNNKGKKQQQQPAKPAPVHEVSMLDIRVGKIIEVWKNPASEKLYNEKIDLGNGEIRSIASGLQKFVPIEKMQDQMVIVLCNLKEKKLADYPSHGMVLCAETPERDHVELIHPPEGSKPGDLIHFEGFERQVADPMPMKKWEKVQKELVITENSQASYKDVAFKTETGGICKCTSIKNGIIH